MIRARVWFRCAAMHDPVQPLLIRPATIGWRGRFRSVELTIQRPFKGEELVRRMKGWVTVDPEEFLHVVRPHGWLKVFDDGGLVVEMEDEGRFQELERELARAFGEEVELERLQE